LKPAISLALWPRFVHRALRRAFFAGIVTASLATSAAPSGLPTNHPLNKQAPDFALTGLNGQMLRLSGFRGKVVLLNFWATWCAPCQAEMPVFAAWQHRDAPRGFQVIGISMDDDAASARRLVERLKLNYPSALAMRSSPRATEACLGCRSLSSSTGMAWCARVIKGRPM
jgi:thiol-disulfide isomerase/thioredoxin